MSGFKTIVLTTDFSDTAREAFEPALELARAFDSTLWLIYVEEDRLPPFAGEFPGIQGVPLNEILDSHRKRAEEELTRIAGELEHGRVQTRVLSGTPHREVVRFAEEQRADLVVMATHGRGFIAHALMGSTTERVIRHAPCPVMAVRKGSEPGV